MRVRLNEWLLVNGCESLADCLHVMAYLILNIPILLEDDLVEV